MRLAMSLVRGSMFLILGIGLVACLMGCTTAPGNQKAEKAAAVAVAGLEGQQGPSASSEVAANTKADATPPWLTTFPKDPNYFIGIAGSPDTGDPSSDIEMARRNARNALASEIQTTIQSSTNLKARDNSHGDAEQSLTMLIDEQVNLRLPGVELVDSYHSPQWGYWFYYRLARQALDPRPVVAKGVDELTGRLSPPVRIVLGGITYSDTGLSSALSLYLIDQLLLALRDKQGVTVATLRPSAGPEGEAKQASGSASPEDVLLLSGSFFGESAGVIQVFLRLTDEATGSVVANASLSLDGSALPTSLSLVPANYTTALPAKQEITDIEPLETRASADLQVRLWTDRGDGATYLDGEYLVVNFSASRNCYIKVYHIDVNGHAEVILPNRYSHDGFVSAGKLYRIPAPGAPYRFLLGKPYGAEFIKVLASTVPFKETENAFTDLGQATRSLLSRGLSVVGTGDIERAEALLSYTILGRGD